MGILSRGLESCGCDAGMSTILSIIMSTIAMILLLLHVAKCITAENVKPNRNTTAKEPEQLKATQGKRKEKLFCPMCGWQHSAEQKVCRNPKCKVRF